MSLLDAMFKMKHKLLIYPKSSLNIDADGANIIGMEPLCGSSVHNTCITQDGKIVCLS